jgi:hypothetical protein
MCSTSQQSSADALLSRLNNNASSSSLLGSFMLENDFFRPRLLLSLLSINNVTNLSMACRQMNALVHSNRSYPCIVWEERRPATIGYMECKTSSSPPPPHYRNHRAATTTTTTTTSRRAIVSQIQTFHFVYHTTIHQTIQVKYSLVNAVWDEHDNMRDGL